MKRIISLCDELNIPVNDSQVMQLQRLYEKLVETNKVMNLTAITDKDEVIVKHFVDSLSALPVICELCGVNDISLIPSDFKIIDVGTGAGFPGIPLKLMLPQCEFVLMDSVNKKLNFINDVISDLGLDGIFTIHSRAEDLAFDLAYRDNFDLCVSRAVANLSTLSEYCLPFVKTDGFFISYKSGESEEEINNSKSAIKQLSGKIVKVHNFTLPGSDNMRSLVCIKKTGITDKRFPRKAGMPNRNPLK